MEKPECKKAASMLSAYIENKLNNEDKVFVENHINQCTSCFNKYVEMKAIIRNLHKEYEKMLDEFERIEDNKTFNIREYESFYDNISPYIDDELSYNDSVKFRKYLLKSKTARAELANAYNLKNNINHSISTFKNNANINYSKKIINRLKNENKDSFDRMYHKAAVILVIMFSLLIFVSALIGYSYINKASAININETIAMDFPIDEENWVEFSFDENNNVFLTAK